MIERKSLIIAFSLFSYNYGKILNNESQEDTNFSATNVIMSLLRSLNHELVFKNDSKISTS